MFVFIRLLIEQIVRRFVRSRHVIRPRSYVLFDRTDLIVLSNHRMNHFRCAFLQKDLLKESRLFTQRFFVDGSSVYGVLGANSRSARGHGFL